MKEEKRESRWKGIIMLVLGFIFMLPVLLIVMNSFKTGKEILTNFVSFPTSLYLDNFTRAMKTMRYASSFMNSAIITILTVYFINRQLSGGIWNFTFKRKAIIRFLHLFHSGAGYSFSCGYDCNYHYG